MTPTITIGKEIWAPNRDFRNPEELVNRIKEAQKSGIDQITDEEQFYVLLNGMKNLGIGMRNLQTQVNQLNMKLNPQPPTPTPPFPTQSPPPQIKPIEPSIKKKETTKL